MLITKKRITFVPKYATYSFQNMLQFQKLKKLLKSDISALTPIKLYLVGDTATQFLTTAIKGIGIELGYNINLIEGHIVNSSQQLNGVDILINAAQHIM